MQSRSLNERLKQVDGQLRALLVEPVVTPLVVETDGGNCDKITLAKQVTASNKKSSDLRAFNASISVGGDVDFDRFDPNYIGVEPVGVVCVTQFRELVAHLKLTALFRKRTVALIMVLKEKAIKFCLDWDMTEEQKLQFICSAVSKSLIPDDDELAAISRIQAPASQMRCTLVNEVHSGARGVYEGHESQIHPDFIAKMGILDRITLRLSSWFNPIGDNAMGLPLD